MKTPPARKKAPVKNRLLQLHVFPLEPSEKDDEYRHDEKDGHPSSQVGFHGARLDPVPQGDEQADGTEDEIKPFPDGKSQDKGKGQADTEGQENSQESTP